MLDEVRKAVETLANPKGGWVSRRDAAETLGKAGGMAVMALRQFEQEQDVDVQNAVARAINDLQHSLKDAHVSPTPARDVPLDELVKAVEKPGKRDVIAERGRFAIHVLLPGARKQIVYASMHKDRDGADAIQLVSVCSPLTTDVLEKALRANMNIAHGALAAGEFDGEPRLMFVRFLEFPGTTAARFKSAVKQVAFHTDWMEQKLGTNSDAF